MRLVLQRWVLLYFTIDSGKVLAEQRAPIGQRASCIDKGQHQCAPTILFKVDLLSILIDQSEVRGFGSGAWLDFSLFTFSQIGIAGLDNDRVLEPCTSGIDNQGGLNFRTGRQF